MDKLLNITPKSKNICVKKLKIAYIQMKPSWIFKKPFNYIKDDSLEISVTLANF